MVLVHSSSSMRKMDQIWCCGVCWLTYSCTYSCTYPVCRLKTCCFGVLSHYEVFLHHVSLCVTARWFIGAPPLHLFLFEFNQIPHFPACTWLVVVSTMCKRSGKRFLCSTSWAKRLAARLLSACHKWKEEVGAWLTATTSRSRMLVWHVLHSAGVSCNLTAMCSFTPISGQNFYGCCFADEKHSSSSWVTAWWEWSWGF